MALSPLRLDHVALWVEDRDRIASFATERLGMHEIERTGAFTLIGADAERFKLTLFAADGPREPGPLQHVALRVSDLARSEAAAGGPSVELGEGLRIVLVEGETPVEYDLDHVALAVPDPSRSADAWRLLGFHPARPSGDGAVRIGLAGAYLELLRGLAAQPDKPLLNHIAVLVESADDLRDQAAEAGAEIVEVKDAENTYAVFVNGPDGVKLEYVEHKPSFSLV
jgi:catechol 2,3-dioxygenase-like lactoylglutathione lyase family enzyme